MKSLLFDNNPENDIEALAMWGGMNGADTDGLRGWARREREQKQKLEIEAAKAATDRQGPGAGRLHRTMVGMPDTVVGKAYDTDTEIRQEASEEVGRLGYLASEADRFMAMANEIAEKHGWNWLGAGWIENLERMRLPTEMQTLQGISEILIQEMKKPGSGTFTDKDAERAGRSVINFNMDREGIERAARHARIMADRARMQAEFYDVYNNGPDGGVGSMEAARGLWNQYKYAVPMFVEYSDGSVRENPDNMSIYEWMGSSADGGVSGPEGRAGGGASLSGSSTDELNAILNGG